MPRMSDPEALIATLAEALLVRGQRMATAESCTGGLVAKLLTDHAGSSAWFERGLVTYSNQAKQDLLGVPERILQSHGAVSQATARAMVEGLCLRAPVQWGLSITGIAGPGGGSPEKPVGTVWFGWRGADGRVDAERRLFAGDRDAVRRQSAVHALQGLWDRLRAG